MDEHHKGDAGIHRTGFCAQVLLRCRPCLRMASARPRSVPLPVDCDIPAARTLSLRHAPLPERRTSRRYDKTQTRYRNYGRTYIYRFRHIHDTRTLGCTMQGHQRFHSADEHTRLQSQQQGGKGCIPRLRRRNGRGCTYRKTNAA